VNYGQRYFADVDVSEGFSFSGGDLPFSEDGVHEFDDNAKTENYTDHRRVERQMKRFNKRYTEMVDFLKTAFNCPSPDQEQKSKEAYGAAIGLMRNMPSAASNIVGAAKRDGIKAGIPFQYKSTDESAIA